MSVHACRVCVPKCLVTIYACFQQRDFRSLGVIVGKRTILTVGHTVAPGLDRGVLERVIVSDYPRRLFRGMVLGTYASRDTGGVPMSVLREGVTSIYLERDPIVDERTAPYWEDSIARLGPRHGPLKEPAFLLVESGLLPWPCETAQGFSGAPLFDEDLNLVGVHYGREVMGPTGRPLWAPLPEETPWGHTPGTSDLDGPSGP